MSTTLTPTHIETIKATVPFLQENGLALTQHFYKRLFEGNPEVKEFFNSSNQKSGNQQQALGSAICAFAQNIETPQNLAAAVSRISHKHASLGIKPEHYPIVGEHLLGSIDDLLNPAPPEILEAWAAAYGFLAGVLMGAEKEIYTSQADAGWEGFTKARVIKKVKESDTITSFYLITEDARPLAPFQPGQYLTVRLPLPAGAGGCPVTGHGAPSTTMRNYSLSGSPAWAHYRISVKREQGTDGSPDGYASNYLHSEVELGDTVEIAAPCGDFFLGDHVQETRLLLLSGGVGITPVLSMLHASKSSKIDFIHGAINSNFHALAGEVNELAAKNPAIKPHFRYSHPSDADIAESNHHSTGYIDQELLKQYITPETEIYFCGPKPMMIQVYTALKSLGHPAEKIHFEFFGPHDELEA